MSVKAQVTSVGDPDDLVKVINTYVTAHEKSLEAHAANQNAYVAYQNSVSTKTAALKQVSEVLPTSGVKVIKLKDKLVLIQKTSGYDPIITILNKDALVVGD